MGRALLHLMRQGRCLEELFCLQEIKWGGCVLSGGFCHLTLCHSRSFSVPYTSHLWKNQGARRALSIEF